MFSYQINKILPYNKDQMFDLVADIDNYSKFLPWVDKSVILEKNKDYLIADLHVGYKNIYKDYRSKVLLDRDNYQIKAEALTGPFKYLYQEWKFIDLNNYTKIEFNISFSLNSNMLEMIIRSLSKQLCNKFLDAFIVQADKIYG